MICQTAWQVRKEKVELDPKNLTYLLPRRWMQLDVVPQFLAGSVPWDSF